MNPSIDGLFEAEYAASPFVYVDVGARGGIDQRWRPIKKHFLAVLFEADELAYKELFPASQSDPALKQIFAALHNVPGEIPLKIGGRMVRHARRIVFQLAEVPVGREIFAAVLDRLRGLSLVPASVAPRGTRWWGGGEKGGSVAYEGDPAGWRWSRTTISGAQKGRLWLKPVSRAQEVRG